jgi:hypothetical protein
MNGWRAVGERDSHHKPTCAIRASQRRGSMNTQANQIPIKPRSLQIEATGDFWRGNVKPRIRLCGQWLKRAGFDAGCRVEIQLDEPGKLTLQLVRTESEN